MKIVKWERGKRSLFQEGKGNRAREARIVRNILQDVRRYGDRAVRKYTLRFDRVQLKALEVSRSEIEDSWSQVNPDIVRAMRKAASRIRDFAKQQYSLLKGAKLASGGVRMGERVIPLERVGCYVPGGRYPLCSTALMSVIPAKVAGVREVLVFSPRMQPLVMVAASMAGADRMFRVGGAQAIGAMAYGTRTIPKVDKIVGPGNRYVAEAKRQVFGSVGIDFVAGPSEVLILADRTGDPGCIAADLLAQAEHDAKAKVGVITTSRRLASKILSELSAQMKQARTMAVTRNPIERGTIVLVSSLAEAAEIANEISPEHLEVQVRRESEVVGKLRNYGALFLGKNSAEVFGDYCSGTNHILPTAGAARYAGGLSVREFVRIASYQKAGKKGVGSLANIASKLAEAEGLWAHKAAAEMRVKRKI